jgi:hypothetical protein
MSQTLPSSLVAQTQPAPETLGVALVLGVIIGAGMAYHAHSSGRSEVVWGLVGFVLGIIGLLIYVGYLVLGPSPEGEKPGPDVAGPASEPAEARTRPASATGVPEPENGAGVSSAGDNQWRQVASEVGGDNPATGAALDGPDRQNSGPGDQPRATEERGASAGGGSVDRQPEPGSGDGDPSPGVGGPSGSPAGRAGMALELTYSDGQTDLLSGVTQVERDGRALVVTREDGTERRYENSRIERVWDERDG